MPNKNQKRQSHQEYLFIFVHYSEETIKAGGRWKKSELSIKIKLCSYLSDEIVGNFGVNKECILQK